MKKLLVMLIVLLMSMAETYANEIGFDESQLDSLDYYLVNLNDQRVILDKNADKKIYPASMTKIMTAILVIENTTNFDKRIIITEDDLQLSKDYNASIVGLQLNEEITVDDALHGMLLSSGADAAHAAAVHMAGSEEEFVKIMNQKAKFLGLNDTHYVNCSGIHDENHYTTLQDLSILFQYCMKNEKFKQIMGTASYSIKIDGKETHELNSYHKILFDKQGFDNAYILGAKTGYTPEAGDCMVSIAEYNGNQFLFASAEAPVINSEYKANVGDAISIYKAVLNQYKKVSIPQQEGLNISEEDLQVHIPKLYKEANIETRMEDGRFVISYGNNLLKTIPLSKDDNIPVIYMIVGLCILSCVVLMPFLYVCRK